MMLTPRELKDQNPNLQFLNVGGSKKMIFQPVIQDYESEKAVQSPFNSIGRSVDLHLI